jgi:hypothetical protein
VLASWDGQSAQVCWHDVGRHRRPGPPEPCSLPSGPASAGGLSAAAGRPVIGPPPGGWSLWGGSYGGWPAWGPASRWPSWRSTPWGLPSDGRDGQGPGWRPPPGDYRPGDPLPWDAVPRRPSRRDAPVWSSKAGRRSSRRGTPRGRRERHLDPQPADPARYVVGLLAWQGAAWLILAAIGLGVWLATLPSGMALGSATSVALWKSAELLAIAFGAGIGAAQGCMACRLRGGRGMVRGAAAGLRALTVAAGLVAGAVSVLLVGSVMELIVLNGTLAADAPSGPRGQ